MIERKNSIQNYNRKKKFNPKLELKGKNSIQNYDRKKKFNPKL